MLSTEIGCRRAVQPGTHWPEIAVGDSMPKMQNAASNAGGQARVPARELVVKFRHDSPLNSVIPRQSFTTPTRLRSALRRFGALVAVYFAGLTAGGVHVPSMIEGAFSTGQYSRSIRLNLPDGAGNQLETFSSPGESC